MPAASETLPVLEEQLVQRLLAFECLDEACPRGRTAIERRSACGARCPGSPPFGTASSPPEPRDPARRRGAAPVVAPGLNQTEHFEPRQHALLAPPDARNLVASVLAVVEREVDAPAPLRSA